MFENDSLAQTQSHDALPDHGNLDNVVKGLNIPSEIELKSSGSYPRLTTVILKAQPCSKKKRKRKLSAIKLTGKADRKGN